MSQVFLKKYRILCFSVYLLILLGGSVRAMNAGLACPDWPLCFGDFIPDYHPQVYFEFLHRVFAGLVSFGILGLNLQLILAEKVVKKVKALCWLSFLLLIAQIVLGGLTVLWALKSEVVIWHLGMGTGLLMCLCWIGFNIHEEKLEPIRAKQLAPKASLIAPVFFLVIYGQVLLGGLVASNYAGLACSGFPLCNGEWIPTLTGPVGFHVIHRFGAYLTFIVSLLFFEFTRKALSKQEFELRAAQAFYLVLIQLFVGVASFFLAIPPLMTVVHLGLGTLLMVISLRAVFLGRKAQTIGNA